MSFQSKNRSQIEMPGRSWRRRLHHFVSDWVDGVLRSGRNVRPWKGRFEGQSLCIVASGPSARALDFPALDAAPVRVMTVNNSLRMFAGSRIDFHAVSDSQCMAENVADWSELDVEIGAGIYRAEFENLIRDQGHIGRLNDVLYVGCRSGGLIKRGFQHDLSRGIGNDFSVICFAAQVALYLGFQEVGLAGVDLNWSGPNPYSYEMSDRDRAVERSDAVARKRHQVANAQTEFALLREGYDAVGARLLAIQPTGIETLPTVSLSKFLENSAIDR